MPVKVIVPDGLKLVRRFLFLNIDATQQGDFGVFGTVAYDERATFNVISVDSVMILVLP